CGWIPTALCRKRVSFIAPAAGPRSSASTTIPIRTSSSRSGFNGTAALPAIPDGPDWRLRPARPKRAAIVAATVKTGPAEIMHVAVIAVILRHRVDVPVAPFALGEAAHHVPLRV